MSQWPQSLCVTKNRQKHKYLRYRFNCDLCAGKGSLLPRLLTARKHRHPHAETGIYIIKGTHSVTCQDWRGVYEAFAEWERATSYSIRASSQLWKPRSAAGSDAAAVSTETNVGLLALQVSLLHSERGSPTASQLARQVASDASHRWGRVWRGCKNPARPIVALPKTRGKASNGIFQGNKMAK